MSLFKKKEKSEDEIWKDYMVKKYSLVEDTDVPNRFWINNEEFIDFIPGDKESREEAEKHY